MDYQSQIESLSDKISNKIESLAEHNQNLKDFVITW